MPLMLLDTSSPAVKVAKGAKKAMNGMLLQKPNKGQVRCWLVVSLQCCFVVVFTRSQAHVLLYRPQSKSSESADRCQMFTAHSVTALWPWQSLQQQHIHSPMRLLCRPSSAASCLICRQVCAPEWHIKISAL